MIKAEDLRIGDLVIVSETGCMIPKGVVCKVVAIDSEKFLEEMNLKGCATLKELEVNHCDISCGVWCKYISPIPLTPEILEKNGWKKKREGWYIKNIDKYDYLSAEFEYEDGIRVFLKRAVNGLYAKLNTANNVQELQHILWVLGEDANLKI